MDLQVGKALIEGIKKLDVGKFIQELTERLEKMEQELMIDRFEGNIAICEDRKTGKIQEIERKQLPEDIQEGDMLIYQDGNYRRDTEKQTEIENRIAKKMEDLWK
ncbi:MAG: DUF3006 domain-containing protein [Clostridia bacterium]